MILQKELIEHRDKFGVPPVTIDKDWVLGHFLNALYLNNDVQKFFVFKGGTCLRKCYFENYRFSEDLDFTLLNKDFKISQSFINSILKQTHQISGIKFEALSTIKNQIHKDIEQGYEIEIRFWGADHKLSQKPLPVNRWQTSIKIDISFSEKIILPPVKRHIFHA